MNLDGASASKPSLEFPRTLPNTQKPIHKPAKLRRLMSIGSRAGKPPSIPDAYRRHDTFTPLQALSPRPTESEPCAPAKKLPRRSISTFLLSRTGSLHTAEPVERGDPGGAAGGHLPGAETALSSRTAATSGEAGDGSADEKWLPAADSADKLVKSQPRKDSVTKPFYDMPLLVSRSAALSSHPVGEEDLKSEGFQTPREFGAQPMGAHVDR